MAALSVVRDIALIIASLSGAMVAWKGLSTWRRQMKGTVEYELARRQLRSAYKVRDEISRFRNPFMSASELTTAASESGNSVSPASQEASHAAYVRRWNRLVTAHSDFEVESLELEVLLGQRARIAADKLTACLKQLNAALAMHFMKDANLDSATRQSVLLRLNQTSTDPTKDEMTAAVGEAIGAIETIARPLLKR